MERDEIRDEMTSGDPGSAVEGFAECEREGMDLRRRDSNDEADKTGASSLDTEASSARSIAATIGLVGCFSFYSQWVICAGLLNRGWSPSTPGEVLLLPSPVQETVTDERRRRAG